MSTAITVKCLVCGNIYATKPHRILQGHKCKICALKERKSSNNKKKSHDEFIKELNMINENIYIMSEYKTAKTPVSCKCKVCEFAWDARPTNLLNNKTGCPNCARLTSSMKQAKVSDVFISELHEVNPDITIIGGYINNHTNVLCRCNICENEWFATPANLLSGTGCPKHKASHGERTIIKWLDSHNINYIYQKKFDELKGVGDKPLPYDFYIPDYNCLIEYQGSFHDHTDRLQTDEEYEIRKLHDTHKKEYAIDKGFNFIEIWYYDNIEEKLQEMFNMIDPVTTTAS